MCSITNPDSFIWSKDEKTGVVPDQIAAETVKFSQWKRVKVVIGGKVKDNTRLVSVEVPTEEFKTLCKNEMESFKEHVGRVKSQYKLALQNLKEKLKITWTSYTAIGLCRRLPLPKHRRSPECILWSGQRNYISGGCLL